MFEKAFLGEVHIKVEIKIVRVEIVSRLVNSLTNSHCAS